MILRISVLLVALLTLPALYIFRKWMGPWRSAGWRRLFLLPNAVLVLLTVLFSWRGDMVATRGMAVAVYLAACFAVGVPETLYAAVRGAAAGRRWDRAAAAVAAAVAFLSVAVGVAACFAPVGVKRITFSSRSLPAAFDGYRIVLVSDLHVGTFDFCPEALRRAVEAANAEHADLAVFGGDLVNYSADELPRHRAALVALCARDGVVAVMGNHDYLPYIHCSEAERQRGIAQVQTVERAMGWRLLLNSHLFLRRGTDSIAVVGSENEGRNPLHCHGNLRAAVNGIPAGTFQVLASHDPWQWRRKVLPQTDIQLTLSGHTHAGQFAVAGVSPCRLWSGEWLGLYRCGGRGLVVSGGVGEALMPFRLGAWPSIDVITLKRE